MTAPHGHDDRDTPSLDAPILSEADRERVASDSLAAHDHVEEVRRG